MGDEKSALEKLVVDEKDTARETERLVVEASKHFRIERPSGKIFFQKFGSLNIKQKIAIVLAGKYFAYRLELIAAPELSISEIGKELGMPITSLSGGVKELVKTGYVEYLPIRKYRVVYHRLKEIFESLLSGANTR